MSKVRIYLGEVETTRRVKKLVLTGEETSWGYNAQSEFFYLSTVTPDYLKLKDTITSFCSHYKSVAQTIDAAALNNGEQSFWYAETVQQLYIKDTNYTSITSFKQYLADQYAAGTPVCVWYVLATPTTGIVNEPLRKIGDYADTVSYEQAGVSIPTLHGNTVIDVETTLKPSEMYIKYQE